MRRPHAPALLALLPALLLGAAVRPARGDGEVELRRNQVVKSIERVRPALVSVRTTQMVAQRWLDWDDVVIRQERQEVEGSLGSGVIFHPAGFVITNAHVILHASNLYVQRAGEEQGEGRRAVEFAVDLANDLAILRILPVEGSQAPETFPYLPLGRSDDLMLGETVIAVGNPFKLGLSVSTGVIGGLNRSLNLGRHRFDDFVQLDAAINPGNSGGALLDVTGRWIGVTTAIYARTHGAEGLAFAIPSDRVRRLVGTAFKRRLLDGDWLGIDEVEGPGGAPQVRRVFPRGPAAGTGLKENDVVLRVNGVATPTLYDYAMTMLEVRAGSTVRLQVSRDGRPLGEPMGLSLVPVPTAALSDQHLGLTASDVADYDAGVVVKSARPGGPAAKVGLRPGDVIVALGKWTIRNSDDLLIFLQYVSPGDLVDVIVRRSGADASAPLSDGRMRAE